jgi:hypothetical protein
VIDDPVDGPEGGKVCREFAEHGHCARLQAASSEIA